MERRNNLEITAEILQIAVTGAKKSHIVYGANLNHQFLEQYLTKLEAKGLIERVQEPRRTFLTTEKGAAFTRQYRELLNLIRS